jgi:hypothetical protein
MLVVGCLVVSGFCCRWWVGSIVTTARFCSPCVVMDGWFVPVDGVLALSFGLPMLGG